MINYFEPPPKRYCEDGGKQRYSRAAAEHTRIYRMEMGAKDLRIYKCPTCFDWHLTSKTTEKRWKGRE